MCVIHILPFRCQIKESQSTWQERFQEQSQGRGDRWWCTCSTASSGSPRGCSSPPLEDSYGLVKTRGRKQCRVTWSGRKDKLTFLKTWTFRQNRNMMDSISRPKQLILICDIYNGCSPTSFANPRGLWCVDWTAELFYYISVIFCGFIQLINHHFRGLHVIQIWWHSTYELIQVKLQSRITRFYIQHFDLYNHCDKLMNRALKVYVDAKLALEELFGLQWLIKV